jgi:DNA-binding MarR family transcriptional regulator
MMKAEGFQRLVPFLGDISRELAQGFRLTPPRLFALVVICDRKKATKDAIQQAARALPPEVESVGLHRLRHRSRANQVLRDLWRQGLLTRVQSSDSRSPTYYASPQVQQCIRAYQRRARHSSRDSSARAR